MRILIRTSKWAIWSRRLGSFAVPLLVVPVLLHRERLVPSETFHLLGLVAIGVAALAVLLALAAFFRLWHTGDRGWGRAATGIVLGLICIAPVAYGVFEAFRYPAVIDLSTNPGRPVLLTSNTLTAPVDAAEAELVASVFPNLLQRRYALGAQPVFDIVEALVTERDWEIRQRREPVSSLGEGQINAFAMTLIGWRDEVAIRVTGDAAGTTVDMRSAALRGIRDMGQNGRRIEEFLLALDAAVTVYQRDNATAVVEDEEEPTEPIAVEP